MHKYNSLEIALGHNWPSTPMDIELTSWNLKEQISFSWIEITLKWKYMDYIVQNAQGQLLWKGLCGIVK